MTNVERVLRRSFRRRRSVAVLSAWLLGMLAASAQYPVTYPTNAQVTKDGAMILLQNAPPAVRTEGRRLTQAPEMTLLRRERHAPEPGTRSGG